ncbi:MAG: hypothetical protein JWM19_2010 [Actinomycetia bacterium]|nr:hypothetical protein [Actinomycetes bacterium]
MTGVFLYAGLTVPVIAVGFGSQAFPKLHPAVGDAVILPGCGHWIGEERPAEVNAALLTFLAVDSGAFTELSTCGTWRTGPVGYVQAAARYAAGVGRVVWAAPQDWMCEPAVIHGGVVQVKGFPGTHLSVRVHQHRIVLNYVTLVGLWPPGRRDRPVRGAGCRARPGVPAPAGQRRRTLWTLRSRCG